MSAVESKEFDINKVRNDFPLIDKSKQVYFDNAATTQKPQILLDTIDNYYTTLNANVHRGVHSLSRQATEAFEDARKTVANFVGAKSHNEIIWTKGTTDAINLIAHSVGKKYIKPGDEILITEMEHHSNIVPWQMLCEQYGAKLKYIPLVENSQLDYSKLDQLITDKTIFVSLVHVSNSLGTKNDINQVIDKAHKVGAKVLVDGAQAIQHTSIDVQELDCDFYCFSAHKIYAPLGIGVLYGKERFLDELPPYQGGGEMISKVTMEDTVYNELPYKFEAGTPNIVGAIGLASTLDYVSDIGVNNIDKYESELLQYAESKIDQFEGIFRYSNAKERKSILSFNFENVYHYDLGMILDKMGIAVRTGHHCCQPVMQHFGIQGTVRASFSFYNTKEEVDKMIDAIGNALKMLR